MVENQLEKDMELHGNWEKTIMVQRHQGFPGSGTFGGRF